MELWITAGGGLGSSEDAERGGFREVRLKSVCVTESETVELWACVRARCQVGMWGDGRAGRSRRLEREMDEEKGGKKRVGLCEQEQGLGRCAWRGMVTLTMSRQEVCRVQDRDEPDMPHRSREGRAKISARRRF